MIVTRECHEHQVFEALLKLCPDLEEWLLESSEEGIGKIADFVIMPLQLLFQLIFKIH